MCTVTSATMSKGPEEEKFNWSANTLFLESPLGILLNKYDSGGSLTTEEKETLQGWFVNNGETPPEDLCT